MLYICKFSNKFDLKQTKRVLHREKEVGERWERGGKKERGEKQSGR